MHAFCRFEKFDACCWYSRAKVMGTSVCLTGTLALCFWQSPSESPGSTINPSAVLAKPLTLDKAIYNDWIVGSLCLLAAAIIQSCTTVLQSGVVVAIGITFQTWCIINKGPVLVAIFSPIQTVTTVVLSAILLRQIITLGRYRLINNLSLRSLAGMVLMFAGLYSVLWAKKNECFSLIGVDGDEKLRVEDDEEPLLLS
ncbi:hypothetical protein BHE74_00052525 [Ensete ventricosum]|nr:hypothetical protein BHE74_00052525 [Ensete ventricosum]